MINEVYKSNEISIYKIESEEKQYLLRQYLVSTPQTREICNDPELCGISFTDALEKATINLLHSIPYLSSIKLEEKNSVVMNILRASLVFNLRDALGKAYKWNKPEMLYYTDESPIESPDNGHFIEQRSINSILSTDAQIIIPAIIRSGAHLRKSLELLINEYLIQHKKIQNILIICLGSQYAADIAEYFEFFCSKEMPEFKGIDLFFFEGIFTLAEQHTQIEKNRSDLIKKEAMLAPDYLHSLYEMPLYALERCSIYNAADRAFNIRNYIEDVTGYWNKTRKLCGQGNTYIDLMNERAPFIETQRFGKQNILSLCEQHISKLERIIQPEEENEEE